MTHGYKVPEHTQQKDYGKPVHDKRFPLGEYITWDQDGDLLAGTVLGVYEQGVEVLPDRLWAKSKLIPWSVMDSSSFNGI